MGQENTAPRKINGVEGALGQIMQSQGPGVVEQWTNPSAIGVDYGLSFYGTVSGIAAAPKFQCSDLAGFDADFFKGYWAYVVWDAGGAAAQPQGQMLQCTGYAAGDFTVAAFAPNAIAVGDKVLLLHPSIATTIDTTSGLAALQVLLAAITAAGPTNVQLEAARDAVIAAIPAMVGTDGAALAADWTGALATALSAYTAAKAAFIDVAISSRAPSATALSTAQWTNALATALGNYTAARAGYLDNINQAGLLQVTAARAALLDQITALRLAELDAANIPADIDTLKTRLPAVLSAVRIGYLDELDAGNLPATTDNILLDTQIRVIQSGVQAILAAATEWLHIDSGTNGAEILSITISGLIGHDWTLATYVPAADAVAAPAADDKRDTIAYLAADTEGGLLKPFGIPFNAYLKFTNDGANDQIDQVTITYRSRGVLTLTWGA